MPFPAIGGGRGEYLRVLSGHLSLPCEWPFDRATRFFFLATTSNNDLSDVFAVIYQLIN